MLEDVKTIVLKEGDMYVLEGPNDTMKIGVVHGKIHYWMSKRKDQK
jgi:hypothetical protein